MSDSNLSSSLEDYLEAIYLLCQQERVASANRIAQMLSVSKSSVTWALNQLHEKNLVHYTPYEPITLTESGLVAAQAVDSRHSQIRNFLIDVLGVDDITAQQNACKLEHVIAPAVLEGMARFTDFLKKCPRNGRDWLEIYRYNCNEGQNQQKCDECISQIDSKNIIPVSDRSDTPISETAPKVTKDRDKDLAERLILLFQEQGQPLTDSQLLIIKTFMGMERHLTALALLQEVQLLDKTVTQEEVQTMLEILCEYRIARQMSFDGQDIYEHLHPESHHDHFYCIQCGSIQEFYDPRLESLQDDNARRASFRPLQHTLNIMGVCRDCLKLDAKSRKLSECRQGERLRVTRITGQRDIQSQLSALGISRGAYIEVLNDKCVNDGVIIMSRGARMMLDGSLAGHIRTKTLRLGDDDTTDQQPRHRHRHPAEQMDGPDHYDEQFGR